MTTAEKQTLLDTLKKARYSGVRSTADGQQSVSFAPDEELERKIQALERDIAATTGTKHYVLLQHSRG